MKKNGLLIFSVASALIELSTELFFLQKNYEHNRCTKYK
jgi:hypothetical protein